MGVCMEFDNHIKHLSDQRVTVKEFWAEPPASLQIVVNLSERIARFQGSAFLAHEIIGNVIMQVNNTMM